MSKMDAMPLYLAIIMLELANTYSCASATLCLSGTVVLHSYPSTYQGRFLSINKEQYKVNFIAPAKHY